MTILESKDHSPIAGNRDRVKASAPSLEGMQAEARQIHPFRAAASIQRRQNALQLGNMILRNPSGPALLVKRLQTAMAE